MPSPGGNPKLAIALVCTFAVASSTNYTNHGPLFGLIAAEFGLKSSDVGLLPSAFFIGSATSLILGGWLADRGGARLTVTLGFGLIALSNIACGLLAPDFTSLIAWRALGGLGSGAAFAAGTAYTRAIFADRGAHLAQGLYGASFLLGSGLPLLFMPQLVGGDGDWRRAFVISGVAVSLCWLAWALLAPASSARSHTQAGFVEILRYGNVWILALCHMCGFGLAIVVSNWATSYFVREFGLPLGLAGALSTLLLVTGIFTRPSGGALLERGLPPWRLIRFSLLVVLVGLLLMALPIGSLPLAILGMLVTGVGAGLPYAAVFNGAAASVPRSPGLVLAMVGWGSLWITFLGPPIIGALFDLTGSFSASFFALAGLALAAFAATFKLTPVTLHRSPQPGVSTTPVVSEG